MKILDQFKTLELLCASTKKWGMLISWYDKAVEPETLFQELMKAAPYLDVDKHAQAMIESQAYLIFDSEEEMLLHYNMTVGDDGPTHLNAYHGPLHVYAITCYPDGQLGTENT